MSEEIYTINASVLEHMRQGTGPFSPEFVENTFSPSPPKKIIWKQPKEYEILMKEREKPIISPAVVKKYEEKKALMQTKQSDYEEQQKEARYMIKKL